MNRIGMFLLFSLMGMAAFAQANYREHLPLNGTWQMELDPDATVKPNDVFSDAVQLPGTTDTNGKGNPLQRKDETTHLSRLFSYVGRAWYKKTVEIPASWKKKRIFMHLERTKPATVYVDGIMAGSSQNISTPQVYELTSFLKPGKHIIAIMVDNSENALPKQIITNSHACTEDTQTNWNGILGNMTLEAVNDLVIDNIQVKTSAEKREIETAITIRGNMSKGASLQLMLIPWGDDYGYVIATHDIAKSKDTESTLRFAFQVDSMKLWSEFHPRFYRLRAEIVKHDCLESTVGMRDFTARGTQFFINGNLTFLRGKHDACVFPNTAHVPTNIQEWRRYFQICKGYGINHVRFHSWCPPEACFLAADIEGVYLQPELPFWGDFNKDDKRLMEFLLKEGLNIMRTYAHHPSFVMMALGNELWGDIPSMKLFTDAFRKIDGTKLFTFGSNYYLGYQGWKEGMDYFTTCRNGGEAWGEHNTHTRGSFSFADAADGGMINSLYPNTLMNFEEGIKGCPVPVIGHETAQFQTYPDFHEIRKYRGVLYPYNLEVFRSRLEKAGMLDQAADFHQASGLWSVQLYKQDIEMGLRTPGFGGFQLLDLQDYPGQGSAYVGMLDAFMESKGITTPQEFSQWCSPIVPLFLMEKFCWTADETLVGKVKLANYSEPCGLTKWLDGTVKWEMQREDGTVVNTGELPIPEESIGLTDIGNIAINLSAFTKAQRLNLVLHTYYNKLSSIRYTNTYPIWVYPPSHAANITAGDIVIAGEINDEMGEILNNGATVLLLPCYGNEKHAIEENTGKAQQNNAASPAIIAADTAKIAHFIGGMNPNLTVGGLFQTDYWNYRMFKTISENNKKPVSPGTLGILTNPQHPIFSEFPTDMHTNWQWFPIVKSSRPFILDNTAAAYRPIVQVIDNIERNHKLGLVFEFSVGKGKLLVCMSPLLQLQQYPEARQLYRSIVRYMQSPAFNPASHITFNDLRKLFTMPVKEGEIGELNNISPYQ